MFEVNDFLGLYTEERAKQLLPAVIKSHWPGAPKLGDINLPIGVPFGMLSSGDYNELADNYKSAHRLLSIMSANKDKLSIVPMEVAFPDVTRAYALVWNRQISHGGLMRMFNRMAAVDGNFNTLFDSGYGSITCSSKIILDFINSKIQNDDWEFTDQFFANCEQGVPLQVMLGDFLSSDELDPMSQHIGQFVEYDAEQKTVNVEFDVSNILRDKGSKTNGWFSVRNVCPVRSA